MSDFRKIRDLVSKISQLLDTAEKNEGQFSAIDKDIAVQHLRELYEQFIAVEPVVLNSSKATVTSETESSEPLRPVAPVAVEKPEVNEEYKVPPKEEVKTIPLQPIVAAENTEAGKVIAAEESPKVEVVKKKAAENNFGKSISELFAEKTENGKATLNERYKSEGKVIADKLKQTPIKDLKSYIGLNKRFTFINSLFKGSESKYEEAIATVNSFGSYEQAVTYIRDQLVSQYEWKDEESAVSEFFNLVMRRYLN
jgi:hypothetical protein